MQVDVRDVSDLGAFTAEDELAENPVPADQVRLEFSGSESVTVELDRVQLDELVEALGAARADLDGAPSCEGTGCANRATFRTEGSEWYCLAHVPPPVSGPTAHWCSTCGAPLLPNDEGDLRHPEGFALFEHELVPTHEQPLVEVMVLRRQEDEPPVRHMGFVSVADGRSLMLTSGGRGLLLPVSVIHHIEIASASLDLGQCG